MQDIAMLDLDDSNSIHPSLNALLDAPGVWGKLQGDVTGNYEIFHEFAHADEYITKPLVRALRGDAERLIRSEYTSVAAYHACRPADRTSYTTNGLLRTTEKLLRQLTHDAFGDTPQIEEAFAPVCAKYLEWYDGTIGLFHSAHETTSWHKAGCFLGKMADALGSDGQTLFNDFLARTIPTIVKSKIPLDWVDNKMREPAVSRYASAALQRMILMRAMPENATNDLGALGLKCDIPPEKIIGFLNPPDQ